MNTPHTLATGAATATTRILEAPIAPCALTTTAPVVASPVVSLIEFASVKDATRLFSLSRSTLYDLEKRKLIRFVRVRRPGNATGRTLVVCESLRNFLAECAAENEATAGGRPAAQGKNAGDGGMGHV